MSTELQPAARTLLQLRSAATGRLEGARKEPPVGGLDAASICLAGAAGGH